MFCKGAAGALYRRRLARTVGGMDTSAALTPQPPGFWPWVGRTFLHLLGWELEGQTPAVDKAVIIAAPHTSNWDFPLAVAVALVHRFHFRWLGKDALFKMPFWGAFMRFLGGIPVDRSGPHGVVASVVERFSHAEPMVLMIPPEGSRSKTTGWKTGFYYIAREAQVPIILGYMDYRRKRAGASRLFYPTGDIDKDFGEFKRFYAGVTGKFPEHQSEVRVQPSHQKKA